MLIQFTPLHDANTCKLSVKNPANGMEFNTSSAFLNITKIPFYIENHIDNEIFTMDREMRKREVSAGEPSLLPLHEHERLRDVNYKI